MSDIKKRRVISHSLLEECLRESRRKELQAINEELSLANKKRSSLSNAEARKQLEQLIDKELDKENDADTNQQQCISELQISFKNVFRIAHLEGFGKVSFRHSLKILRLDNNVITQINGLNHLCNLQILDLSFNQITKMENLDDLINLKELVLSNNHISEIQNLQNNTKLEILSLSNNNIQDFDRNLGYLESIPACQTLKALILRSNPFLTEHTIDNSLYIQRCVQSMTSLKWLDYSRVQRKKKKPEHKDGNGDGNDEEDEEEEDPMMDEEKEQRESQKTEEEEKQQQKMDDQSNKQSMIENNGPTMTTTTTEKSKSILKEWKDEHECLSYKYQYDSEHSPMNQSNSSVVTIDSIIDLWSKLMESITEETLSSGMDIKNDLSDASRQIHTYQIKEIGIIINGIAKEHGLLEELPDFLRI